MWGVGLSFVRVVFSGCGSCFECGSMLAGYVCVVMSDGMLASVVCVACAMS